MRPLQDNHTPYKMRVRLRINMFQIDFHKGLFGRKVKIMLKFSWNNLFQFSRKYNLCYDKDTSII